MTPQEMIEVLQAYERGEKIEVGNLIGTVWQTEENPRWNFMEYKYRIAPKPKQTKKVKMLCWFDGNRLTWWAEDFKSLVGQQRIPAEDKEVEVEID